MESVKEQVNGLEDNPKVHNENVDKSKEVDSGSGSGSENGEKPVREKLKKADLEEANVGSTQPASIPNGNAIEGGSGKLKKKRSYEGLTNEEVEHDTPSEGAHARKKTREATSPTKKGEKTLLRNSKAGSEDPEEVKHSDAESDKIIATPPSSGDEAMIGLIGTNMIKKKRSSEEMLGSQDETARSPKIAATDAERGRRSSSTPVSDRDYNSATKLKKKRSPEEMLGPQDEILKSPKIAATDAKRGRRSSSAPPSDSESKGASKLQRKRSTEEMLDSQDEIVRSPKVAAKEAERDRRSSSALPSDNESKPEDSRAKSTIKAGPPKSVPQEKVAPSKNTTSTIPATSGFGNASSISPFTALASNKTQSLSSEQLPQTSSSAFAGSGFAALAGSNSPFGSVPKAKTASADSSLSTSATAFASSGFASLSGSTSPFGSSVADSKPPSSLGASPFAATTSQSGFGGSSVFRSGFGGGIGGTNKLSSFAAPVGDTKLGQTPVAKPFGAPEVEDDEDDEDGDDNSENEDGYEDDVSSSVADHGAEVSSQFKIRNDQTTGEEEELTSFFSANAKLFQKTDNGWTERGTGPFKLNYKILDSANELNPADLIDMGFPDIEPGEATVEARFIMRSAATHKVTVNARIFKEMIIGDHKGGEPPKRMELLFSSAGEKGLEIYLLRMGKKDDSKELYDQVKKIQSLL